ncbi:hypothetical protein BD779DRAFT_1678886 [Infundibulicybe gibba]|nr:hypothetical protein BD779DRAFT_1678886 [Infundibulicybe gibba]
MPFFIQRHRALITARLEFDLSPVPCLPTITPCVEFTPEHLTPSGTSHRGAAAGDRPGLESDERQGHASVSPDAESDRPLPILSLRKPPKSNKIPKPAGEPGRPGSGGFCVETELAEHGWKKEDISALTEAVRQEARRKLDTTKSFRGQKKERLQGICEEMSDESHWPALVEYADCWPVLSMLKLTLKYGAEASRRTSMKDASQRMREALGSNPGV